MVQRNVALKVRAYWRRKVNCHSTRRSDYWCLASFGGNTELGSCWLSYGARATIPSEVSEGIVALG